MKCPVCGKEYEADKCPNCSGLEITVNESDYLKRKMAYEKKQAKKKSASSSNEVKKIVVPENADKKIDDIRKKSIEAVYKKAEDISVKVKGKKNKAEIKNGSKNKSKNINKTGDVTDIAMRNESGSTLPVTRKRVKHTWKWLVGGAVLLTAIIAVVVSVLVLNKKDYVLYMSSNNKIYNVDGLENTYVCDMNQAVFTVDNKTFYTPDFPQEIDMSKVQQTLASESGKYFSAVSYDDDSKEYTVYVWNKTSSCVISKNKKCANVINITDSGKVIYTDTDIVNDEGAVGGIELYIFSVEQSDDEEQNLSGKLTIIEENVLSVNDYAKKHTLICHNKDLSLYTFDYEAMDGKKGIADDVGRVCAMSDSFDYVYTGKSAVLNNSKNADSVIYSCDGKYFYHNLNKSADEEDMYITDVSTTGEEFIVNKDKSVYMIKLGHLYFAKIIDSKTEEFSDVEIIGQMTDYVYLNNKNCIIIVNSNGQLVSVLDGSKNILSEGITDGSLSVVKNSSDGITYIKNGTQFFRTIDSDKEYVMKESVNIGYTGETYLYKKKLYFYTDTNEMYECTIKGEELNNIGNVEHCWIGSVHK